MRRWEYVKYLEETSPPTFRDSASIVWSPRDSPYVLIFPIGEPSILLFFNGFGIDLNNYFEKIYSPTNIELQMFKVEFGANYIEIMDNVVNTPKWRIE